MWPYCATQPSTNLPAEITNGYLHRAKREQYKLIALSALLNNGVLDEIALGQALTWVQGNEFMSSALHDAAGVITTYAHERGIDPRAGVQA